VILNEVFVFLDAFEMKGRETILWVSWAAKKINEWTLNKAGVKRESLYTVKAGNLVYCGHTMRKQPGERDNARNSAKCTRKTTHGLGGQHQDVGRTPSGRVDQNDNRMEKVRPW